MRRDARAPPVEDKASRRLSSGVSSSEEPSAARRTHELSIRLVTSLTPSERDEMWKDSDDDTNARHNTMRCRAGDRLRGLHIVIVVSRQEEQMSFEKHFASLKYAY